MCSNNCISIKTFLLLQFTINALLDNITKVFRSKIKIQGFRQTRLYAFVMLEYDPNLFSVIC
ncbi:CLUMA_CG018686, isoform A [Clunio marinus]|uniref:CLUMA_CG018686, isoform A n=1 Tax=Clunio marinus TaxID=568069 RepID=A0A1J1J142_9DIPT|nr:CLUMA_CG018686, isoform A [Clunio marinus]